MAERLIHACCMSCFCVVVRYYSVFFEVYDKFRNLSFKRYIILNFYEVISYYVCYKCIIQYSKYCKHIILVDTRVTFFFVQVAHYVEAIVLYMYLQ